VDNVLALLDVSDLNEDMLHGPLLCTMSSEVIHYMEFCNCVKVCASGCCVWQVADVLATFLVRNRLTVATDNFKWYFCLLFEFCFILPVFLLVLLPVVLIPTRAWWYNSMM